MLTQLQEIKLIARCVAFDDRDAFGELVKNYQPSLTKFLYNLTGCDSYLTDDLAQETFVKAWLSIGLFKGASKFKTWLFRIGYNEYLNYVRRKKEVAVESLSLIHVESDRGCDTIDAKIDVPVLLESLGEKERVIVYLYYMEDLPIKKICSITGIPSGTVKVYLSRARVRLAAIMEADNK